MTLHILPVTRLFADEHRAGVRRALTEDGLRRVEIQVTALTALDGLRERRQRAFGGQEPLCGVVDHLRTGLIFDPIRAEWHYRTAHKDSFVAIDKARALLGWKPRLSNAETLCATYDWYLAHLDELREAGTTHRVPWDQQALGMLKRVSSPGRLRSRRDARAARLPGRVPDPRALDVPDQPLARGDAPAAADRLAEYAAMWAERGIRAWGEGWWTTPMTVGDQVGRIVGAPAGSTVMHQNVAVAEAVVLSCFLPADARRNRVVYERENFPSVRYLYQAQPELEVVVCEDDRAIVDAIDERTLLVPISHVLFKTAEIQDVEPIVRRAHEVGAHVILDCYQSAGIVPVDVTALGVDFAVGGSVKWLCGGPGNGWLYVRPDLAERLTPTFTGWQAHELPFGFEEEMRYASGAARFLTGTPNVPRTLRRRRATTSSRRWGSSASA